MAVQAGSASSASRVATTVSATIAQRPQRITITPDPNATAADAAANAGVAVSAPSSYVTVPGLISGVYE